MRAKQNIQNWKLHMKTRYYRHNDPRRGFKICQQMQIASAQRLRFSSEIEKINLMYRQCADKHSQCFMGQPNQNDALQKITILLLLPMVVSIILQNYSYIVHEYVVSMVGIGYCLVNYMNQVNKCRQKFQQANDVLKLQFYEIQRNFQQRWPNFSLVLLRQWNELNETCTQYIEIYEKQSQKLQPHKIQNDQQEDSYISDTDDKENVSPNCLLNKR